ncbi:docking protein 2-like [Sinocyclocheilus rhinocerous]|uniref:docking protein 2-like n=1 Tax=Sinocyclocheilus rhinocerous TaxID=307959 RepID=UPI0007B800FF|nr:PREDICTED: docking protein 2-like [Sinocyclocheilus rhinocerous]
MDVISKEGPLFLQGVKFGKKIWRKSWLILFEPSPAGIGRMELYDMRDRGGLIGSAIARPSGLRKTDKRVIRLTDCLSITPAPGESCPTECSAFFLNTTSCTYTIAAPAQEDWITVLCQLAFQKTQRTEDTKKDKYTTPAVNELYSTWGAGQYQVTVQSTDASQRCRMSGSYLLSSEKEAICLLDLKTGQAIYHWPYRLLRRFGQVKGGIMIEAGRRCHTGEGQFIFLSKQGAQIKRAIEEAIMHQSVQELLAQATALPQEMASKPPSPKSKPPDRPKVKNLPPISVNQDRPRPALQCKHGQQIHKAIEEALAQQSLQELLPPSIPLPQAIPPPPPLPKPKTQGRDKTKINKQLQGNKNQERPCPPTLKKPGQPIHKIIKGVLTHQNVQKASSTPPQQAPPLPPPLPKTKPQDRPKVKKLPPVNTNQDRPCPTVPRRYISLPDPPPCVKSPVSSPDEVLYSVVFPQPKPRSKMNLPKVPTPPSLPPNTETDVTVDKEKEWKSPQEPSEDKNEEAPYTNWTAKATAEQNQPHIQDLYSTVNFAAKRKNRQTEDSDEQEQPNTEQQTPVITSSEIPFDFKETLSSILFKDLSKIPPPFPPRSRGGSSDQLDRIDEQMTD